MLVVLVSLVLYLPLKLRQPDLTPSAAARSFVVYYVGGIAALNESVHATGGLPTVDPAGHGVWTLWGEASVLSRLGVSVKLPPNQLPFTTVAVRPVTLSNVYTYLVYLLYDFGWLGIVVGPFVLGGATMMFHWLVIRDGRFVLVPAVAVGMTTILMSFFGLSLIRDFRYLTVVAAALFVTPRVRRHISAAQHSLLDAQSRSA